MNFFELSWSGVRIPDSDKSVRQKVRYSQMALQTRITCQNPASHFYTNKLHYLISIIIFFLTFEILFFNFSTRNWSICFIYFSTRIFWYHWMIFCLEWFWFDWMIFRLKIFEFDLKLFHSKFSYSIRWFFGSKFLNSIKWFLTRNFLIGFYDFFETKFFGWI